jgi:hypothetical protein
VKKEELLNISQDSRYIEGVYNYCDRWCERCPLTSRCLNYAITEENFGDLNDHDIENQAFWDKLKEMFDVTLEMLTEWAEEQGIDLDEIDVDTVAEEERQLREEAHNHDLSQAARRYGKLVDEWFDLEEALFAQREEALNSIVQLGVGGNEPFEEAEDINDAVEVIHWYQHQIYVKLMRALSQQLDDPEAADAVQSDANGSVKVALIGIDRSIAAWGKLREYFPDCADDLLDILVASDRLRRQAEHVFPRARSFVRPGFDTIANMA